MGVEAGRGRTMLRIYAAAVTLLLLVMTVAMVRSDHDQDAVLNAAAEDDLSDWRAACSDGDLSLSRVEIQDGPQGISTAVDVRHPGGAREWCMALAGLHEADSFFEEGRTYRMRAYVRDLQGSGRSAGLLLANNNFAHRPTEAAQYGGHTDRAWHLLQRTFVATSPGYPDTALYIELPVEGPMHWQITLASVREVDLPAPDLLWEGIPPTRLSLDGPEGAPPDPRIWRHEVGGHGWGNDEVQSYTDRTTNAHLDGQGALVLTARRENVTGADGVRRDYSSARLSTVGNLAVPPDSYIEATMRAPAQKGVRPAFWLIGTNFPEVGWPASGELDIMEGTQRSPFMVRQNIHFPRTSDPDVDAPYGEEAPGGYTTMDSPRDEEFHRYGVYFNDEVVQFYVDREPRLRLTRVEAEERGRAWPFDQPQHLVLNLAVGPNAEETQFPVTMTVSDISIWRGGFPRL